MNDQDLQTQLDVYLNRFATFAAPPRAVGLPRRRRKGLNLLAAVAVVAVVVAILAVPIVLGIHSRHETPAVPPQPTPKVTPGPPLHHNGQIVMSDGPTLVALDVANGAEHAIFSAPAAKVAGPAYSPDGTRIAYLRGGAPGEHSLGGMDSIWVLDTRTGHTRQLTTCAGCSDADSISWSPDGSRLAFSEADPSGNLQLHLIDADSAHGTQLTHFSGVEYAFSGNAYQPTWSPDGTRIAFTFYGDIPTRGALVPTVNIDVIRPDGTGLAVLLTAAAPDRRYDSLRDTEFPHLFPAWSPDGSRIAYILDPSQPGGGIERQVQLWLMNPDGSHRTKIFSPDDACCVGGGTIGAPVWSPDGTRIAIDSASTVWLVSPSGSAAKVPLGLVSGLLGGGTAWQPVP